MPLVDGKKRDPFALANTQSVEEKIFQVVDCERLSSFSIDADGELKYKIAFARNVANTCEVNIGIEMTLKQTCQRCLQPMMQTTTWSSVLACVKTEAEQADLEESYETVILLDEDGLDLLALVEDEAILAVPLVAAHENLADCDSVKVAQLAAVNADKDEPVKENPFAGLKDLLKSE